MQVLSFPYTRGMRVKVRLNTARYGGIRERVDSKWRVRDIARGLSHASQDNLRMGIELVRKRTPIYDSISVSARIARIVTSSFPFLP